MAAIPPSTPAAPQYIINATEASFQQEVLPLSSRMPVLLSFWTDAIASSKELTSSLETLAKEAQGAFVLAKVNINANPNLAQQLQVESTPNVTAIYQGRLINKLTEALPLDELRTWLQSFLGEEAIPTPEADPLEEGKAHLEAGDQSAAIAAFNTHLQKNPGAPESSLALARIAMEKGDAQSAKALIDQIATPLSHSHLSEVAALEFMLNAPPSEHSEEDLRAAIKTNSLDYQARHDLAMLLAGQGKLTDALEELLAIVIRDRSWEDDRARETMVKLFEVMGLQSPDTRTWQKRLGRAMY